MTAPIPPARQHGLQRLLRGVETGVRAGWAQVKVRTGRLQPVTAIPYRGWGTPDRWWVRGRVLERPGTTTSRDTDTAWTNLVASLRRFASAELPGAVVRIHTPGGPVTVTTDPDGFYEHTVDGRGAAPGWHDVDVEVLRPLARGQQPPRVTGRVLVLPSGTPPGAGPRQPPPGAGPSQPPPGAGPSQARFAVVSDLDDTVVRTGLTEGLQAVTTVLLNNARTRSPFAGVAALYQAFAAGTGAGGHPVFYVSGSPWNLYDVLDEFLAHHGLPAGPLLLRDWGLGKGGLYAERTRAFKLRAIRGLLATFPDLRVVLVGDSGQHDPEIYEEVVRDDPARVLAVYVRDVSAAPARDAAVHGVAATVEALGVPMVLAPDSTAAAEHAAAAGFIAPGAVAVVRAAAAAEGSA